MLIQSHNHAYLAILIKVNSLESELQGMHALLERLGTNLVPLVPGPPPESKAPPDQSDYPDVPFWTQSDYETHKQDQKSSGFTSYSRHSSKRKDAVALNRYFVNTDITPCLRDFSIIVLSTGPHKAHSGC
ncbi:hypothetical protein K439DRAFT_1621974 [Ramaria rubella]|nr:hypothetical protein K439DRAFT_1621974 [Ramaria rubella]